MKKIIFLQNHPVFTLDISMIANPAKYDLYLISIPLCIEQLKQRNQQDLFKEIHSLNHFDLPSLISVINTITQGDMKEVDIVTSSEQAMDVCGKLRVHFNLDQDNLERFANKITMKKALQNSSVRCPKYIKFDDIEYSNHPENYINKICQSIPFPMFAKPINEAGSIGTALIKNIDELKEWCLTKDNKKVFEIDEYVEGVMYHCDTFVKNKKIIYSQVCRYLHPCFDFTKGKPLGSIMLPMDSPDAIKIKEFNEMTLSAMGLPINAITHLEVIKKHDGELVFIEVAARPPASLAPKTYKKHLGLSIMETHVLMQIDPQFAPKITFGPYSAFVAYPKQKGTVTKLNKPIIHSQHEVLYNITIGDELESAVKVRDLACSIVLWNNNFEELLQDYFTLDQFKLYEVSTDLEKIS